MLRRAAREPRTFFIGVDADAAAMIEASRRAARPAQRGGTPNAMFVVAAAEALPRELDGRADLVTVALPWGSLLRGLLCPDEQMLAAIGATLRADGELELLVSTTERDGIELVLNDATVDRLTADYGRAGFGCIEARRATTDDVERLSSGWGRRLGIPESRPAWLLRFRYAGVAGASGLGAAGGVSVGVSGGESGGVSAGVSAVVSAGSSSL